MNYFSPHLLDGSVTTVKLADLAVTSAKLDDDAVVQAKLSTIISDQSGTILANGRVTLIQGAYCFAPGMAKDGVNKLEVFDSGVPSSDADFANLTIFNGLGTTKDYDTAWRRMRA